MKIENNVVTLGSVNYGKKENTRRQTAAEKFKANTSAALIWQAAQLASGYDNTAPLNTELRNNKDKSIILLYLQSNEVIKSLATIDNGQLKLKQKREHVEQSDILASFVCDFDTFLTEYNADRDAAKAESKQKKTESKQAKSDLQSATAIVSMLENELAGALPNGAKALELESRLIEAKAAESVALEAYRNKVEPVQQSKLIALLNQAILAGMDTAPTEGLAASLRDLLSTIGGKIDFASENEVESVAFDQSVTLPPSTKSRAANKKSA